LAVVVDNFGLHVDLSKIAGHLWDPTVAEIVWGHRSVEGRLFGTVRLKNGTGRTFWDGEEMLPYLRAWTLRKAEEDLKHALNQQAALDRAEAERAEDHKRDADRRAARLAALAQAIREINDAPFELEAPIGA
jgi:hypothetical protein